MFSTMNSSRNTPTKIKNQNQNKNNNYNNNEDGKSNGGEESREIMEVGQQVFPPATSRATRSSGKEMSVARGRTSRSSPYDPARVVTPHVRLTKVDVVDYKVDKQGSTFKITLGADGGYLRKEEVPPRPGPSGMNPPLPPAENENLENVFQAPPPVPTETMPPSVARGEHGDFDEDSLEESDIDIGDDDAVLAPIEEKRGRGRPPSTWEHVGRRAKEEEKARIRKEAERERLAAESLKPIAPKGKKWAQLQDEEEKLEARLTEAPTGDIASRLMERSVTIFNIAKCSNGLHGNLVKKLQETAILVRAATNVMATRAREMRGEGDRKRLSEQMEELRAENSRLRGEMEQLRACLPPPTVPEPPGASRKARLRKRRRLVESTDSGEEEENRPPSSHKPPPSVDRTNFPPLPQRGEEQRRKQGEGVPPPGEDGACFTSGLTLGGKARRIEAYPPGLPEEKRTEHDALMGALSPLLEGMSLQEDTGGQAYRQLWEQANAIKSMLCSLRGETFVPPPMPAVSASYGFGPGSIGTANPARLSIEQYVSPSVIDKEAGASRSQRGGVQVQREAGPPLPPTPAAPVAPIITAASKGGKKKKKKNKKGKTSPPTAGPQVAKGTADSPKPAHPPRGQQGPELGKKDYPIRKGNLTTPVPAPQLPMVEGDKWTEVVKKKGTRKSEDKTGAMRTPAPVRKGAGGGQPSQQQQQAQPPTPSQKSKGKKKGGKRRVPRTAAVVVTCAEGQYKEVLRLAMERIDPASLGIEGMTARRTVTGAQIFEVGGPDHHRKADALADSLRKITEGREGVRVSRPSPTAELRIRDLTDATVEEDIVRAVASAGHCSPEQVRVGPIRSTGRGMGTAWVRCPLAVANQIATARRLKIGWTMVRVEALETRPLQCFKCLGKGHVRAQCPGTEDRSTACYRCGCPGHLARDCARPVTCPVCLDLGRPAAHRAGSRACNAPKQKKGGAGLKSQMGKPVPPEGGRSQPLLPPAKDMSSTLPAVGERMDIEPLPQRERRVRTGSLPVESSPLINVENTPMEVALEESCGHN